VDRTISLPHCHPQSPSCPSSLVVSWETSLLKPDYVIPIRLIFGAIACLLATIAGLEWRGPQSVPSEIVMLSLAMGMMNPALSKVGAESVSLTFVTGTLNRIGGHLAAAAGRKPLPEGQGPGDSHLARARIDVSVWSGFLGGAALSGMVASHFRMWALLLPASL